jgi:hypothetical protein
MIRGYMCERESDALDMWVFEGNEWYIRVRIRKE